MNQKLTSDNIEGNQNILNTEESDYKNLITKLNEIKETISLLEKTIFK